MCLCLICLGELSTGQRESKPEKKFLWWANPSDPIQLRAIQFIQMTVIQSWLEAIQAALGPRITRGRPRIVIRLSPRPLSVILCIWVCIWICVCISSCICILISCVVKEDVCRTNCDVIHDPCFSHNQCDIVSIKEIMGRPKASFLSLVLHIQQWWKLPWWWQYLLVLLYLPRILSIWIWKTMPLTAPCLTSGFKEALRKCSPA